MVLVVIAGGSVDLSAAKHNPAIGAIVWAGYGGYVRAYTFRARELILLSARHLAVYASGAGALYYRYALRVATY